MNRSTAFVSKLSLPARIVLALSCVGWASVAGGQETNISLSAGIEAMQAHHYLLSGTLFGADITGKVLRRGSPFHLRFGLEHVAGTAKRSGVACTGLIDPPACPTEQLVDHQSLTTAMGGFGIRALTRRRVALEVTADLRAGRVQVDSRGATTTNKISGDKTLWGSTFGAEVAWLPFQAFPLAFELGAASGGLMPLNRAGIVDGYTPFEHGFDVPRIRMGLAWRVDVR